MLPSCINAASCSRGNMIHVPGEHGVNNVAPDTCIDFWPERNFWLTDFCVVIVYMCIYSVEKTQVCQLYAFSQCGVG